MNLTLYFIKLNFNILKTFKNIFSKVFHFPISEVILNAFIPY